MKIARQLTLSILLLLCATMQGRTQEFDVSKDGFIYDSATMARMKLKTDSLNLKFKKCDPWKTYYGFSQSVCDVFEIDSVGVDDAVCDIQAGVSFENLCLLYENARTAKNKIVTWRKYRSGTHDSNFNFIPGANVIELVTISGNGEWIQSITTQDTTAPECIGGNDWVFKKYKGLRGENEGELHAFYFREAFSTRPLPMLYQKMVQYVDFLIDTGSTLFFENAMKIGGTFLFPERGDRPVRVHRNALIDFGYDNRKRIARNERMPEVDTLVSAAVAEALEQGWTDSDLEELIDELNYPEALLTLKRLRLEIGGCGNEQSTPRNHAHDIALLAAKANRFDIFLRAHLDILTNQIVDGLNYNKMFDAKKRETYIHELEALGIDVPSLMLGISFRISNPSGEHYHSSVYRVGRALAETSTPDIVEQKIVAAIEDAELDNYNRVVAYCLYVHYITFLKDPARKAANIVKLRNAVKSLPPGIAEGIPVKDEDFERPWN